MERPISIGSVVYSLAGRDEGRFYIVVEIIDGNFVSIVDGDVRKLEKPKKKKVKHLRVTGEVLEGIAAKIAASAKVYDAEIFSALRKYNP